MIAGNEQYLPNHTLIDHYEIRELLGIGGFGVTYKAWDVQLERWVAIKEFLPADMALRDTGETTVKARTDRVDDYRFALDKFLQEARTLARFDHPNIVRVTRFLEANGTAYLVMDFVEGQSLSQYLKRTGATVPEEQLKAWFIPILNGLARVHAAGFLHRDIKPGNIYMRDEGEPILIDFGAARQAIGEHSRSVTGIVSAGYAPNEQYGTDAKKQGPWTDLYSIGATLYRCIAAKDPVDAPTRQSALVEGDPDPLTPAVEVGKGHYSQPLLQLIDELLVLPIKQRPQSAEPVLAALQADTALAPQEPRSTVVTQVVSPGLQASAGAPEPVPTPRPTPTQATATPPHAGNIWKIMAGLAIVGLLGAVGYLLTQKESAPSPVATASPPVAAVIPMPETSTAVAPPPVAATPTPTPTATPAPVTLTEAPVEATPASAEPVPALDPELPITGQLTLNLTPTNARVVLPDIGPRYELGMKLEPGSYRVKVSAPGYERWEGRVEVTRGDNVHDISLTALPKHQVGNVFRDGLKSGGEGPEMVVLPTGSFQMGCVSGQNCESNEKPVHEVRINRPIAIMKYEVTFADYDRYAEAMGRIKPSDEIWGRGKQPVINVNWEDARGYAKWLSQQTGKHYRLPSEAEWEYAARAGTRTQYSWGNSIGSNRAHCNGCSIQWYKGKAAPVGGFAANAWGLHDMHGNVLEWVEDCYDDSYRGAPTGGAARQSCGTKYRVLRGGSWFSNPANLRSARRSRDTSSNRFNGSGFRLVQDLNP